MELKSEREMKEEFDKRRLEWKPGQSRDGYVLAGEEMCMWKGVRYKLMLLRYFTFSDGFKPLGSQRISDTHAVVEYPEDMEDLVRTIKSLDSWSSDFLYHDTLHSFNDDMSIQEQIDQCHKWARSDIDSIPSKIKAKLKEIEDLKEALKSIGWRDEL
jgi:hypothetical protein